MARFSTENPLLCPQPLQPDAVVSVDTFRADVARMCVEEYGVAIINDIAAGEMDANMFHTVAALNVPYIMMHMQGTPQSMQQHPHYDNLLKEVFLYFARKVQQLRDLGVKDIILDLGFGFGKKAEFMDKMLKKSDPMYASKPDIKWNFTKFLINRKGKVIARFEPTADMKEVEEAVAKSLKD